MSENKHTSWTDAAVSSNKVLLEYPGVWVWSIFSLGSPRSKDTALVEGWNRLCMWTCPLHPSWNQKYLMASSQKTWNWKSHSCGNVYGQKWIEESGEQKTGKWWTDGQSEDSNPRGSRTDETNLRLGPDAGTSPQEGRCWMEPEPAALQNSVIRKGDMSKSIFIFFIHQTG